MACRPSLNGHSEFIGILKSSALEANLLFFIFRVFESWSHNSSCMKTVDNNQSLNTINFVSSSL